MTRRSLKPASLSTCTRILSPSRWQLGKLYESRGDQEAAFQSYLRAKIVSGLPAASITDFQRVVAQSGLRGNWQQELDKALAERPENVCWTQSLYSRVGRTDDALRAIEQSFGESCLGLTFLKVDPVFEPLRGDPRFGRLVRR